ncbi:phospholipid carrier-dependent glycosyltransferase [Comamonas phosphati]|nr:phospholipid carrier-dependent glycosyltransferase [Comamonas phosphati]
MSAAEAGISKQDGWKVLLLVALWFGSTAWLRPLMLPDEGRYASVALEMLHSGDWLTPTLNGLPFFHKPPLFYWISGAALMLTGSNELAARAASLVGAAMGAMALYLFVRRWCGMLSARRAVIVLAVQPLFFLGAQFANLDMLVAGCITATVLALAHAAQSFEAGEADRRALWLAYGLAALGVLAKGLIGFVLPAMIVGLWLILRRRWPSLLALLSLPGALLFLLIAAPWFVLMQQRFDGFLHYFFVVQHFQRFAAGGFNNAQPFWFYPAVLAVCSLPCILWSRQAFTRGYWRAGGVLGDVRLLMALMAACVTFFFSLPQSKLIGYVLPAVPALAWLMADAGHQAFASRRGRGGWRASLALAALIGLAVVLALTVNQRYSARHMGQVLKAQRQLGEPVYMLKEYVYDLPFYAGLDQPVRIVDDWHNPDIARRDNWRREVIDADAFDPALASHLLITPQELPAALCGKGAAWVVGDAQAPRWLPLLAQTPPVFSEHGQTLWRVDTRRGSPCLAAQKRPVAAQQIGSAGDQYEHGGE